MYKIQCIDCDSVPELLKLIKWPQHPLRKSTALAVLHAKVKRQDWRFFELVGV